MADQISMYRVARLAMFPATVGDAGHARWSLVSNVIRGGIPTARILGDGLIPGVPTHPTQEEVVEAMDAALRSMRLY
jgi:hypothetical protein